MEIRCIASSRKVKVCPLFRLHRLDSQTHAGSSIKLAHVG